MHPSIKGACDAIARFVWPRKDEIDQLALALKLRLGRTGYASPQHDRLLVHPADLSAAITFYLCARPGSPLSLEEALGVRKRLQIVCDAGYGFCGVNSLTAAGTVFRGLSVYRGSLSPDRFAHPGAVIASGNAVCVGALASAVPTRVLAQSHSGVPVGIVRTHPHIHDHGVRGALTHAYARGTNALHRHALLLGRVMHALERRAARLSGPTEIALAADPTTVDAWTEHYYGTGLAARKRIEYLAAPDANMPDVARPHRGVYSTETYFLAKLAALSGDSHNLDGGTHAAGLPWPLAWVKDTRHCDRPRADLVSHVFEAAFGFLAWQNGIGPHTTRDVHALDLLPLAAESRGANGEQWIVPGVYDDIEAFAGAVGAKYARDPLALDAGELRKAVEAAKQKAVSPEWDWRFHDAARRWVPPTLAHYNSVVPALAWILCPHIQALSDACDFEFALPLHTDAARRRPTPTFLTTYFTVLCIVYYNQMTDGGNGEHSKPAKRFVPPCAVDVYAYAQSLLTTPVSSAHEMHGPSRYALSPAHLRCERNVAELVAYTHFARKYDPDFDSMTKKHDKEPDVTKLIEAMWAHLPSRDSPECVFPQGFSAERVAEALATSKAAAAKLQSHDAPALGRKASWEHAITQGRHRHHHTHTHTHVRHTRTQSRKKRPPKRRNHRRQRPARSSSSSSSSSSPSSYSNTESEHSVRSIESNSDDRAARSDSSNSSSTEPERKRTHSKHRKHTTHGKHKKKKMCESEYGSSGWMWGKARTPRSVQLARDVAACEGDEAATRRAYIAFFQHRELDDADLRDAFFFLGDAEHEKLAAKDEAVVGDAVARHAAMVLDGTIDPTVDPGTRNSNRADCYQTFLAEIWAAVEHMIQSGGEIADLIWETRRKCREYLRDPREGPTFDDPLLEETWSETPLPHANNPTLARIARYVDPDGASDATRWAAVATHATPRVEGKGKRKTGEPNPFWDNDIHIHTPLSSDEIDLEIPPAGDYYLFDHGGDAHFLRHMERYGLFDDPKDRVAWKKARKQAREAREVETLDHSAPSIPNSYLYSTEVISSSADRQFQIDNGLFRGMWPRIRWCQAQYHELQQGRTATNNSDKLESQKQPQTGHAAPAITDNSDDERANAGPLDVDTNQDIDSDDTPANKIHPAEVVEIPDEIPGLAPLECRDKPIYLSVRRITSAGEEVECRIPKASSWHKEHSASIYILDNNQVVSKQFHGPSFSELSGPPLSKRVVFVLERASWRANAGFKVFRCDSEGNMKKSEFNTLNRNVSRTFASMRNGIERGAAADIVPNNAPEREVIDLLSDSEPEGNAGTYTGPKRGGAVGEGSSSGPEKKKKKKRVAPTLVTTEEPVGNPQPQQNNPFNVAPVQPAPATGIPDVASDPLWATFFENDEELAELVTTFRELFNTDRVFARAFERASRLWAFYKRRSQPSALQRALANEPADAEPEPMAEEDEREEDDGDVNVDISSAESILRSVLVSPDDVQHFMQQLPRNFEQGDTDAVIEEKRAHSLEIMHQFMLFFYTMYGGENEDHALVAGVAADFFFLQPARMEDAKRLIKPEAEPEPEPEKTKTKKKEDDEDTKAIRTALARCYEGRDLVVARSRITAIKKFVRVSAPDGRNTLVPVAYSTRLSQMILSVMRGESKSFTLDAHYSRSGAPSVVTHRVELVLPNNNKSTFEATEGAWIDTEYHKQKIVRAMRKEENEVHYGKFTVDASRPTHGADLETADPDWFAAPENKRFLVFEVSEARKEVVLHAARSYLHNVEGTGKAHVTVYNRVFTASLVAPDAPVPDAGSGGKEEVVEASSSLAAIEPVGVDSEPEIEEVPLSQAETEPASPPPDPDSEPEVLSSQAETEPAGSESEETLSEFSDGNYQFKNGNGRVVIPIIDSSEEEHVEPEPEIPRREIVVIESSSDEEPERDQEPQSEVDIDQLIEQFAGATDEENAASDAELDEDLDALFQT